MNSKHSVKLTGRFGGRDLRYDASLDLVPVRGAKDEVLGTCSVFSYVADLPQEERQARPVTFLFNGGPGAASIFLHLSGLGPKRLAIPDDLTQGQHGPYVLEDSPHSLLDTSDLVFIDPVNTGYGRAAQDAKLDGLYSIEGDAGCFANIIRDWVARHGRWNSPKFAGGESYGTQRAVFLAQALMGFDCMPLNGIILLGQAINVQETMDRPGNLNGALAGLPFKAATAWYHGKGCSGFDTVDDAAAAALEFAYGELAGALLAGTSLAADARERIIGRLEYFTGIPAAHYRRHGLHLSKSDFRKKLLHDEGLQVGAYDARYTVPGNDTAVGESEAEASLTRLMPGYLAAQSTYFREDLQIDLETPYRIFDQQAAAQWNWADRNGGNFMKMGNASPFDTYPYVAKLTGFMKQVPAARLFIGTGHYDALTTVGATVHLLRQYDIDPARVMERRYPAGHMMYSDPGSGIRLNADVRQFIRHSLGATPAPQRLD